MITIHPRSYYIGTTIERVALVLPEDAAGAHFLDTDLGAEYFWNGSTWISGTAGASTFLDLLDTPDSYEDEALKGVRVNAAEDALEFSTDLPDHDHEGDPGDGGVVDHGVLTGLLDNDHTQYLNLTGVARLRAGVVTMYADPDDAFVAADTSGDVILVPPGTWILSNRHTVAAGVSIAGVGGPVETCILSASGVGNGVVQLSVGTGVIQNVKIVASLTAELGTMSALVLNTGNVARNVIVDWTVSAASGTNQGAAIYVIGGEAYHCHAYTHASGSNCHAIGILSLTGTLYFCYGWAELTSGSGVYVTGLFTASTTPVFHCQFENGGVLGSRYGAYIYAATNYLYHCQLTGATADLYVYTDAVAALYATKYTSSAGAGTITHLGGDRAGLAKAETIIGAWTFNENVAVAASKTVDGVDVGSHVHTGAAGQGSKLDHGVALDGLGDDDHTQYILATGARTGATTQNQKFTLDVAPDGAGRGLMTRLVNRIGITTYIDHFRSGVIPSGFTWRGAPFGGTPVSLLYNQAFDYLGCTADGAGTRHFLADDIANLASAWDGRAMWGRIRTGYATEIGFRLDDGTDNNYCEVYVTGALVNATQRLDFRYRTGGGAVTTVASGLIIPCDTYIVTFLYCYSSGGFYFIQGYLISEEGDYVVISGFNSGPLTWIPSAGRLGIMVKNTGNYANVDWFHHIFVLA